jgi:hypothetical protein
MYGKIFSSIYEGTLYGQWEALVTFQQFIVLCDADGIVDMTPPAIAARTSIPLEIITKGISILEKVDPYSRTPEQEGRRIELIDAHRPWGWHIVNHQKYQHMQDADTIRAQTRERVRRHREAKADQRYGNESVTDSNGQKRHTDTDTNTDTGNSKAVRSPKGSRLQIETLPLEWNEFAHKERPDLDPQKTFAGFRDYWIATPGSKGVKADWFATWRNWVRNQKTTARQTKQSTLEARNAAAVAAWKPPEVTNAVN